MIDLVKLKLLAGDGGDGSISLLRQKHRPKGGPDGGDGGRGGSVIVKGNKNLSTLKSFAGVKEFKAQDAKPGGKNKKHGADGEDLIVEVPLGTVVWLVKENQPSLVRRKKFEKSAASFEFDSIAEEEVSAKKTEPAQEIFRLNTLFTREDIKFERFEKDWSGRYLRSRGTNINKLRPVEFNQEKAKKKTFTNLDKILDSTISDQDVTALHLAEVTQDGQELVVCQGGLGGRGNRAFRSSTNQTPLEAEYGTYGEKKEVILELRLLADLGLVGLPNAGKSTLMSRLTKAKPKIADYPFTTLEPNLGVLTSADGKKELVVADIPGLIKGASQGKGLGDRFLRHIENCQTLMYVLFLEETEVFDHVQSTLSKAKQLIAQQQLLQQELEAHHPQLLEKPYLVTVNKLDLYSPELVEEIRQAFMKKGEQVLFFSGVTGEGLQAVKDEVFRVFKDKTDLTSS